MSLENSFIPIPLRSSLTRRSSARYGLIYRSNSYSVGPSENIFWNSKTKMHIVRTYLCFLCSCFFKMFLFCKQIILKRIFLTHWWDQYSIANSCPTSFTCIYLNRLLWCNWFFFLSTYTNYSYTLPFYIRIHYRFILTRVIPYVQRFHYFYERKKTFIFHQSKNVAIKIENFRFSS